MPLLDCSTAHFPLLPLTNRMRTHLPFHLSTHSPASLPPADSNARLAILFDDPGTLVIDFLSLFPSDNVRKGAAQGRLNPWPFRSDLLGALNALQLA